MKAITVEFLIADIVHPDPAQVLLHLYAEKSLTGEVVALTDDGHRPKSLLVVKVPGLSEPVIVPAANTCPHETCPAHSAGPAHPDRYADPDPPSIVEHGPFKHAYRSSPLDPDAF
jgi:hypothetical protein